MAILTTAMLTMAILTMTILTMTILTMAMLTMAILTMTSSASTPCSQVIVLEEQAEATEDAADARDLEHEMQLRREVSSK